MHTGNMSVFWPNKKQEKGAWVFNGAIAQLPGYRFSIALIIENKRSIVHKTTTARISIFEVPGFCRHSGSILGDYPQKDRNSYVIVVNFPIRNSSFDLMNFGVKRAETNFCGVFHKMRV